MLPRLLTALLLTFVYLDTAAGECPDWPPRVPAGSRHAAKTNRPLG